MILYHEDLDVTKLWRVIEGWNVAEQVALQRRAGKTCSGKNKWEFVILILEASVRKEMVI